MSFMALRPEARHLRRIAKAHAAGEIPRQDYRRARRKIIEELHVDFSGAQNASEHPFDQFSFKAEDETRRRTSAETRSFPPDDSVVQETASEVGTEQLNPQRLSGFNGYKEPMFLKPWNVRTIFVSLVLAFVGLAILLGTLAASAESIPSIGKRDPNPNNSLTFPLSTLNVGGFSGLPNLSRSEVDEFLEKELALANAEAGSENGSGFSDAELQELGDLLLRLGIQTEQGLDQSATFALNALAQKQRARRGVSIVQLERIAVRLENLFRDRGYLAARAYVPAQDIVAQAALLYVLPGNVGKVSIDTRSPLARRIEHAFRDQLNRVAERGALESLFYKLNSLPGVRAAGSLGAGESLGETKLNIALDSPRKFIPSISLDNFGDERSSRYRLRAGADWLNPTGRGDRFTLNAALKHQPETASDFSFRYQTAGARLGDTLAASYAHSNFEVNPIGTVSRINGQAQTLEFDYRRMLIGSRTRSLSVGGAFALQELNFEDTTQKLLWLASGIQAHRVLDASRWVLRGGLNLTVGDLHSERYLDQPSFFVTGEGWLSAWKPLGEYSVRLDLAAQLGTEDLPDSHKFRLGGVRRNSSIRPGGFIADSAFLAGVEVVVTPKAWREHGDLKVFSRISHGEVQISGDQESAFVWDGGIAWQMPLSRQLSSSIRLNFPFVTNGIMDSHDRARFLFDISWRP